MLVTDLFIIPPNWKQPNYQNENERTDKQATHSSIKKNKLHFY